jgi:hypothetical protein
LPTCATIASKNKQYYHNRQGKEHMNIDDELPQEETETGSDELLSADNLRLPDSANSLVRLHALRAWLTRRQKETRLEMGTIALDLQQLQQEDQPETRLRRRELQARQDRQQSLQERFQHTQQLLSVYEEAEGLLEDCVNHTTVSERLLVEYYLTIDTLIQEAIQGHEGQQSPQLVALSDVLYRIEQVGAPHEED